MWRGRWGRGLQAGQPLLAAFLLSTHTQAVSIRMNLQAACLSSVVNALTKVWVVVQYEFQCLESMPRHPLSTGLGARHLVSKKVLFEYTVVNVHLAQYCHLLAFDVRGCGLIPNPHTDTVTHRELPHVEDRVGG